MTSDKVKSAIIAYLSNNLEITVVDSERFDDVELPCVTVKIASVEKLSLALAKADNVTIEITYRAHSGDDSRGDAMDVAEAIDDLLNDPESIKSAVNEDLDGVLVDYLFFSGSMPEWDESTLNQQWQATCYAQRA
jgi:hypothetical protein